VAKPIASPGGSRTVLLPVALSGGVLIVVDERLVELPQAFVATLWI
jgi:hypothetical protein